MANDDEKRTPEDAEDEREAPEGTDEEQHDDAETDEDSGEDASDSEDADEEGDEDDEAGDDETDDEDAPAAKSAEGAKKKTGRKHKGSSKITAGQRLAAAKAAKAAKKVAQRGKEAEVVEEQAVETAEVASTWLDRNRKRLLGAFAAVLLIGGGYFGIRAMQQKSAAEAANLLWEATEILNAPIRAEGEDAEETEGDEDEPSYATIAARADAALAKLDELLSQHAGSSAEAWARLEQGRARYQKGEHAAAREAFEAALATGGEAVAPRALEGIAFSYEAEENWSEATARFEQLREEGGALAILADYHLARLHLAQDQEDPAKTKLQAVLEALREEDAPELAYVRDQAELRLMAIDSSLVQRDAAGAMDPAEMQRLIEQLTRQQQQQGGAP